MTKAPSMASPPPHMDAVIHGYGKYQFSPYDLNQSLSIPQILLSSFATPANVHWVRRLSEFSKSGNPQIVILALSVAWTLSRLISQTSDSSGSRPKASKIRWHYELVSQAARIAAIVFLSLALFRGESHVLNVVATSYAFVLGLLRLINDLHWRHVALHQINFVMSLMLVVLVTGHLLPCVQTGSKCVENIGIVGATAALTVATVVSFITPREWVPPQIRHDIPGRDPDSEPAPEETCSWFTYYCSYEWLTPVILKGTKRKLDMSHIPKIAWYDEPLYLLEKVQKARSIAKGTLWTVLRFQKQELSLMAIWIAMGYTVENFAAYGMFKLLEYLANPKDAVYKPWLWLIIMFVGPLARSVCFQQYVFNSTRLVVRIKSAFTQELYDTALKSMELEEDPFELQGDKAGSNEKKFQKSTSAGRLSNLMASDVDAIFRARDMIMATVGVPTGTIISFIGMYRMLGWASLVGTVILFLATPLSVWLGKRMLHSQRSVRKAQDSRMSLVTEYLASLRAIKYFAWEEPITDKIIEARSAEQKELWRVLVLQTIMNQVTQIFPYISLIVMFALHVGLEKHRLDAATAFTTIYLVKNIRRNIMQVSAFGRNFAGALVSIARLDKYFESVVPLVQHPEGSLRIQGASFRRNKKATFTLDDISIDFVEGGLNVVSGQSGSGKSTLLLAILGETYLEGGSVTRPADVAFASQSTWLQNDTIKENILFGSSMEATRYNRVIEACCLMEDFKDLPEKDSTIVSENGTSLSGGQKARVALARALYSKAPVLLLDDVFSALDAKTSAGVWKHCFCGDLLKGRTTVLVTNVPWIAEQGDLSIILEKGQVKSAEPNIGVVRQPITIAQVLGGDVEESDSSETDVESEIQPSGDAINNVAKAREDKAPRDLVDQEMKASGKVGRLTFLHYMGYFGHPIFAISCLLGLIINSCFSFGATFWLSIWVEAYNHQAHVDIVFYMGIFALFTFLEIALYAVVIIGFEWGAWRAARKLHNDFIHAIMRVSLSWFKHIPIGRITNRFSGDMASIDGQLSSMLRSTLDALVMLIFRVGAVSSIMPIFMIPAFCTCFFGIVIGEMYTRTAVIIRRLTSSSQSPVFSQFADTLAGLSVIRARAGMSKAFQEELAARLRTWSAAAEANFNANRWVAVRVDFVTALVAVSAGIIAISQTGVVAAGLVGFSLSNANGLSQTILMLVRAMNDLEVEMQSFHRVKEYVKLEPEDNEDEAWPREGGYTDDASHVIPSNWPATGEIEFRNVTIRYDPEGPNILTNVNLKFKAGERVAIVGRTGSGKSTLVLSLLRFTHIISGQILYSGVDITKVPRHLLRESLTIIPQEAVLFNGTVESNLDPSGQIPHEILEKALDNCKGIASFSFSQANERENGQDSTDGRDQALHDDAQDISLSTTVDARGENFSHGQRQVLSLCRALIRQSKLMLLDEATASMDYETDRGIQQVLRKELEATGGDRTLVTIAHRLRTIIDYDTVVVMSAGRVLECGSPRDLYNAKGQFYDMVYHSGEMEHLQGVLEKK